jgi:hypothetical protein
VARGGSEIKTRSTADRRAQCTRQAIEDQIKASIVSREDRGEVEDREMENVE